MKFSRKLRQKKMIEVVGNDRIVGAHVSHNKNNNKKKKSTKRESEREMGIKGEWGLIFYLSNK